MRVSRFDGVSESRYVVQKFTFYPPRDEGELCKVGVVTNRVFPRPIRGSVNQFRRLSIPAFQRYVCCALFHGSELSFFSHQLPDEERAVQREGLVLAPLAADVEAAAGVQRLEEGPEAGKGAAEVLGRVEAEGGHL